MPVPRPTRRFPSHEETDACFIVRDADRQALAYVFESGRFDICLRPDAITSAVGV